MDDLDKAYTFLLISLVVGIIVFIVVYVILDLKIATFFSIISFIFAYVYLIFKEEKKVEIKIKCSICEKKRKILQDKFNKNHGKCTKCNGYGEIKNNILEVSCWA